MRLRNVIAVVGLSGVGKTTILREIQKTVSFTHLSAGELIALARQSVSHDDLRLADIDTNQQLLITGFKNHVPQEGLIILDGHVIIDTPNGIQNIHPDVFSRMGVSKIINIIDDEENIRSHRILDDKRKRPSRSLQELIEQQSLSVKRSYMIAKSLRIPLFICPANNPLYIARLLSVV